MKPKVLLPVILGVSLVILGLAWFNYQAAVARAEDQRQSIPAPSSDFDPFRDLKPVTPEMLESSASRQGEVAPDFTLVDTEGVSFTLSESLADGPVFLYFIEVDCPCCTTGTPVYSALARLHGEHVTTVGIINATGERSRDWVERNRPPFRVLEDPDLRVIDEFGVLAGLTTILVDREGRMVAHHPGISQDIVRELNVLMATTAGAPVPAFETTAAPERLLAGCMY